MPELVGIGSIAANRPVDQTRYSILGNARHAYDVKPAFVYSDPACEHDSKWLALVQRWWRNPVKKRRQELRSSLHDGISGTWCERANLPPALWGDGHRGSGSEPPKEFIEREKHARGSAIGFEAPRPKRVVEDDDDWQTKDCEGKEHEIVSRARVDDREARPETPRFSE
jgi:hypothetical protein